MSEVTFPANSDDRLAKIADMHCEMKRGGMTSGVCNECSWNWPCPTYRWATEDGIDISCTWDLAECAFEEHGQHDRGRL